MALLINELPRVAVFEVKGGLHRNSEVEVSSFPGVCEQVVVAEASAFGETIRQLANQDEDTAHGLVRFQLTDFAG